MQNIALNILSLKINNLQLTTSPNPSPSDLYLLKDRGSIIYVKLPTNA
jgi:hypothetical protein